MKLKNILGILIICAALVNLFYFTEAASSKGGEINLVRPDSPYIDHNHVPAEYLSNEDLVFYTCIEEEDTQVRSSILCEDDTSFTDIELYNWEGENNCYIGSYDLNEKTCRDIVIESEYTKDDEDVTIRKDVKVNRFSSLLELVTEEQYSDGGWKNSTETASGIWVLSNYASIFEDEIALANKWLKLNRNNEQKCWPNRDCSTEQTAKIVSYLTLADNNDSLRVMHDGKNFLKKKQNYYEPGDMWNLTVGPFERGTTNCIITYKRDHLNNKNFSIEENETKTYMLDASYDEKLMVICDQNVYANLTNKDNEQVFIYEGDNMSYSMPYACWPKDEKWGECDPTATVYALTTDINEDRKEAAYKYLEEYRKENDDDEEFLNTKESPIDTSLYTFVLKNNSAEYETRPFISWLRFRQNNNGSWGGGSFDEKIRPTAYSIMALMQNDFSRNHEVISDAEDWINHQELKLSKNKTSDYKGWNSTEKNALAFTVLKNNARPVLKITPRIIVMDENNLEIEIYNPTTFPLDDITYEFSGELEDKVEIEKKREEISAFSYIKIKLQKKEKDLDNLQGYLTMYNNDKEIAKTPMIVANFPSIEMEPVEEHINVFGKTSQINFDVEKTDHKFDCELSWDEEDISSKDEFRIDSNDLKFDISFSEAERVENTYNGEFECTAMNHEFNLPFSIDVSRYSDFPFSLDPESITVNKSGETKNFTIQNQLDESIEVDASFAKESSHFELSQESFTIDPNGEKDIQVYNNAPPHVNVTETNTISVEALGEEKSINFKAFIYAEPKVMGSGLLFWVLIVAGVVLAGGGGYAAYYYWETIKNFLKKGKQADQLEMKIKKLEQKEKKTAILNMVQIMRMLNKEDKQVRKRLQEEGFTEDEIEEALKAEQEGEIQGEAEEEQQQ
ncbi:MAG: hypothetical protein ACOCQX_01485 [Candidatus Nanoarchaeia archaeon]